jgi:hypothetical protein
MCAWNPLDRPTHVEVQEEIRAIQQDAGLAPDLDRFAHRVVAPLWENRPFERPRDHKAWPDVRFLETARPDAVHTDTATPPPPRVAEADQRVREFLSQEGWETRKRELKWLLALEPGWTEAPFVEILDRSVARPWWRVWGQGPSDDELAVALEVLKHRPSARVAEYGLRFAHHPDDRVAAAANVVISRAASAKD